ncbi:MAG: hypothetical protein ACYC7E_04530 [Armatimonadota bacterium]
MSSQSLQFISANRFPQCDESDILAFEPGVNVITGEQDAGKSKWLSMLDYLMGDSDTPEAAFGERLAVKYERVIAEIQVGEERLAVERRWQEKGSRGKVFVNGESIVADQFSRLLLEHLGIPVLHLPKGNPFSDNTWPELSWRSLLRHIYQQERFWSDFAERQPEREQHACVAQFLGVAEALYPPAFGDLIACQKELAKLQAQRENYSATLHRVATELLYQRELSVSITEQSIQDSEQRIQSELADIETRRAEIMAAIREQQEAKDNALTDAVKERYELIKAERDRQLANLAGIQDRIRELHVYDRALESELERNARLQAVTPIFADLRVTHCPVCDQPAECESDSHICYLCNRPYPSDYKESSSALSRLAFEVDQLNEEAGEMGDLITQLGKEAVEYEIAISDASEELERLSADLASAKKHAAALLPPDFALLGEQQGRLLEQLAQLQRVRNALQYQDALRARIKDVEDEEKHLRAIVDIQTPIVDFGELSSIMEDGMNSYMNVLNSGGIERWQHGPLTFSFRERDFRVLLGKRKWDDELGATSQAMVLFAYHYALLSLCHHGRFNYPGIVIIDFPVQLADGSSIMGSENYLVEPFIALCHTLGQNNAQFIAAGRSFTGLEGAHRIELPPRIDDDNVAG